MCTQLLGGMTTVNVSLRGFTDTDRHGLHIHYVGSTAQQCMAAAGYFDPPIAQGLPDNKRFVDLRFIIFMIYVVFPPFTTATVML